VIIPMTVSTSLPEEHHHDELRRQKDHHTLVELFPSARARQEKNTLTEVFSIRQTPFGRLEAKIVGSRSSMSKKPPKMCVLIRRWQLHPWMAARNQLL
jgi:hypothetical protein